MAVFTDEGKTYHVRVGKGDIGRYVLLPGDPFRTDLIASYFDDAKLVAHNREHKTWTARSTAFPSPSSPPAWAARPPRSAWKS